MFVFFLFLLLLFFFFFFFTFLIQSESSGLFSFLFSFFSLLFIITQWPPLGTKKWSLRPFFFLLFFIFFFSRVGRRHGKIRQSPGQLLTLLVKQTNKNKTKQTNKQTKVKLLCTVLHNNDGLDCCYIMITHLKACWIAIMPLFEFKIIFFFLK